jgi:hypothetical protein
VPASLRFLIFCASSTEIRQIQAIVPPRFDFRSAARFRGLAKRKEFGHIKGQMGKLSEQGRGF